MKALDIEISGTLGISYINSSVVKDIIGIPYNVDNLLASSSIMRALCVLSYTFSIIPYFIYLVGLC
jgi:hypothetical protein